MTGDSETPAGPDLTQGVDFAELERDGKLVGRVGEEEVLLVLRDDQVFAIGAHCSHYHAPLVDGLVLGGEIHCPWHHASFDLATGEVLRAPALDSLPCWTVERRDGKVFVRGERTAKTRAPAPAETSKTVVIVGGGAAGLAAAAELRRLGFAGKLVMLSAEDAPPLDRPNLSKDYLAGGAPEEWLPLRPENFYSENGIDLRLGAVAKGLDAKARRLTLADGSALEFDRLLLATGAEPVRLQIPGAELPHVRTLRSLADCREIIARATKARRVVVLGASFIGLEVAASLRARGLEVHVAAPEKIPMERVLGAEVGAFVRKLHEEHGVIFHLEDVATAIDERRVTLKSGKSLEAELVVAGVGVRPRLELAEKAGLAMDRGVLVDAFLETSAPGIYAAGDIARWPDPHSRARIRVEHWVVAERQGALAARNMLGARETFDAVPFFWSQHYDTPINYVGHAEGWDAIEVEGDIAARDCLLRYMRGGRALAVASIFRDIDSLRAEAEMERIAPSVK
ncbi:MAG: FAD-dependent oxidoreductase [Methylocystis sp.]|jgi:NADPH-dependent 2,4-dienoyl-CoA reductase/sulfur reductase-like enzyme/nitrite reductase/ring-hydroxylating ferredoxin subunit